MILKEDVLRPGDELIVTELDRLGRNKQEILKELQYFRDMGVRVKVLELPTVTHRVLYQNGIEKVGDIVKYTELQVNSIHGFGRKSLIYLKNSLRRFNLNLKEQEPLKN